MEQIGLWAGFILTLMVFSYLLGDNVLYRLAVYVFVGLAAGYIVIVTWDSVLVPWLNGTILRAGVGLGDIVTGVVPLAIGALLLLKASPRLGRIGSLALAFLIGIGTAVALVGAISGTLLPLVMATGTSPTVNSVNSLFMIIGVVCTLIYFQYVGRRAAAMSVRNLPVQALAWVGQAMIVITLGALYAAAILTSLTIFSERISFILARIGGS
ncbi:MAG: hypothetical protein K8L99_08970 [Anaerolineae bacterium]|nr:hypothetical protein [Anaerolineae bacterium]